MVHLATVDLQFGSGLGAEGDLVIGQDQVAGQRRHVAAGQVDGLPDRLPKACSPSVSQWSPTRASQPFGARSRESRSASHSATRPRSRRHWLHIGSTPGSIGSRRRRRRRRARRTVHSPVMDEHPPESGALRDARVIGRADCRDEAGGGRGTATTSRWPACPRDDAEFAPCPAPANSPRRSGDGCWTEPSSAAPDCPRSRAACTSSRAGSCTWDAGQPRRAEGDRGGGVALERLLLVRLDERRTSRSRSTAAVAARPGRERGAARLSLAQASRRASPAA